MRSRVLLVLFLLAGALAVRPAVAGLTGPDGAGVPPVLAALDDATDGHLDWSVSRATGAGSMVRATDGRLLARVARGVAPEAAARTFLADHGAVLGMSAVERQHVRQLSGAPTGFTGGSELVLVSAERDAVTGITHVDFDQWFRGMEVFGGRVSVHLGRGGVTAVNGVFVPAVDVAPAAFDAAAARKLALADVRRAHPGETLTVEEVDRQIYREGLIEGRPGRTRLTHVVEVTGDHVGQQVFVDANDGAVVNSIPLHHTAKDRCVYTPAYVNPTGGDELAVRDEGDPATHVPPVDSLYDYSGQVYDFFSAMFGRDSWDGAGHKMRTVYDATAVCPNAYWDGNTKIARFCPGFDVDDVVAHEWGHAYTQATHGLIYQNQPGALNESYSDIWGEVIDLTNGVDGIGGSDNANPSPVGQRWILGEDLLAVGEALALRDMYHPESRSQPGKVSAATYVCGTGDGGGVHTNSSVPNHAFAMLVDGQTYNGHTVQGIGLTRASHIYWQAMVAYQTPTSGFLEHAAALRAACSDLVGAVLTPVPGDPAGLTIDGAHCAQLEVAMAAVELEDAPAQCGGPLLDQATPAPCPGGTTIFTEDWESGTDGWTFAETYADPGNSTGSPFILTDALPQGRAGRAAFAQASRASGCPGTDVGGVVTVYAVALDPPKPNPEGVVSITSPTLTAEKGMTLRFNHYVATEELNDGANVLVSVDGGDFEPLATTDYAFNPPAVTLEGSPKEGQAAWSGTDTGLLTGTWGTSIADLSGVVSPGQTFRLRFESGQDCAGGLEGWYVDEIAVLSCPPVTAPELVLGEDYTEPDADGTFTLAWTRHPEATGPDTIQEAVVGAPIFADDAESGLDRWVTSVEGAGALEWRTAPSKPNHPSTVFFAQGNEATTGTAALLTSKERVAIPAAGQSVLTFKEWSYNHAGDKTVVEVSEDGAVWKQVFTRSTPYALAGEASLAAEPMFHRSVDLTAWAGRSVHLRFTFRQGAEVYVDVPRYGWHVDDIAVSNLVWQEVATVAGTSHTLARPAGTYLYRVSTRFGTRPSLASNVVRARVS